MSLKTPIFVIVPSMAFMAVLGIFCYAVLGDYFVAWAWHLRHGNHSMIRGYRVPVPLLWWRVDYLGETSDCRELFPQTLGTLVKGDAVIECWPVADSQVATSEKQALRMAQSDASHPISADKPGDVVAVIQLRQAKNMMSCVREEIPSFSSLVCYLPGAPVVLRYSGNPKFERDAESILSSMR